jgi:hypothetical protein
MFHISVKIGITRKPRKPRKQKELTSVACHHCGKVYTMHIKNIRASNYCTTCK